MLKITGILIGMAFLLYLTPGAAISQSHQDSAVAKAAKAIEKSNERDKSAWQKTKEGTKEGWEKTKEVTNKGVEKTKEGTKTAYHETKKGVKKGAKWTEKAAKKTWKKTKKVAHGVKEGLKDDDDKPKDEEKK